MVAQKYSIKYLQDNLLFNLVLIAVFVIFLADLSSANGYIPAAPGQAVTDYLVLSGGSPAEISITLPTFPTLNLSPKSSPKVVPSINPLVVNFIKSGNCPWQISVYATNDGCLAQFDPSASPPDYVTPRKKLQEPMKIGFDTGDWVDLSIGGPLISGGTSGAIPLLISQEVTWLDEPLRDGQFYRIDISFIASIMPC